MACSFRFTWTAPFAVSALATRCYRARAMSRRRGLAGGQFSRACEWTTPILLHFFRQKGLRLQFKKAITSSCEIAPLGNHGEPSYKEFFRDGAALPPCA